MKTCLKILKHHDYIIEKRFKIPSISKPGQYHIVDVLSNRTFRCDCVAGSMKQLCNHIKKVMKYMLIEYEDTCWYCEMKTGLDEHHLWRGIHRKNSPTVHICRRCHDRATKSKWFEEHLQKLYLMVLTKEQINKLEICLNQRIQ